MKTKSRFTSGRLAAFVLVGGWVASLLALPAAAQDDPGAVRLPAAVRSSPFDPPMEDVFVADDGPGLDTGCTFNTDANHPLIIDVMIDKAVGPVDGNGFLVDPGTLVADGVVPATVEVTLPAFDVDVNGTPPPESDEILLNGESLGFLSGDNNVWKLNAFSVGIDKIKFPAPSPGGAPTPVANRIQINIDTLSSGRWCTAIDWVALVIPIDLPTAFKLEPTVANDIRERDYGSSDTIDVIYEQSFDASCEVMTDIGPYDDYPFSGSATPGSARLHATVSFCPADASADPEVQVDWSIGGTSLTGVSTWTGLEGDVDLTMPSEVGAYDVELVFTIDGEAKPAINRKLFVTHAAPLAAVAPPRLGWYEKATDWASGQTTEDTILSSLLSGLYSYGQANWRYGYNFGVKTKCNWLDLVEDPSTCDYADCFIFSDVLQNMAATLGVGGLVPVTPLGSSMMGFLTSGAPSLDPMFPGNAKPISATAYDRYVFSSHSLRLKNSRYYDSTFNGIYTGPTEFITANINGPMTADGDGPYRPTAEGWNLYPRAGTVYDGWGRWDYKSPPGPIFEGPTESAAASTAGISFTGNADFDTLDEDLDGLFEALTAEVEVVLDANGEYVVFGTLQKSGELVANRPAWESMLPVSETIDAIAGTHTITLRFSGEQIHRSDLDGPYELVLFGIGPAGFTSATIATPAYDHSLFAELPARLLGVSEAAVDTDGDGTFEHLEAMVDLKVRVDSQLHLQGALSKEGQSIDDTGVSQFLAAGLRQVTLRFDGGKILRSGLDGPYEGSVNLIDAAGATIDGLQFTTGAYDGGSFSALLLPSGPFSDQGVDTNGNGLYDLLRIDFGADVGQAGSYLLTGVLRSAASSAAVYADSSVILAAGPASLRIEFPGPVIRSLELDGPYTVDVLVRDPSTLEELDALTLPQATAAYLATQFDGFGGSDLPIVLTGNSMDSGIDTDGNGLYDLLRVEVELALARTDFYEWSARLVDRNGTEIGFYTRRATLPAGLVDIELQFDGERIGMNGVDGPYFVKSLLIFGRTGPNLVSIDVAETAAYPVTAFEGAGDFEPPQITLADGPTVLWPPNHQYQSLSVADLVVEVTDNVDATVSVDDVVILSASSDEPDDAEASGDGSTSNDVVVSSDCRSVDLRSERGGGGNGRVYTLELGVADVSGNVGTASYTVVVPHDSRDGGAVDDGPAYVVEGCSP